MIQLLNFFDRENVQICAFLKKNKERAFFCALILYLIIAFLCTSFYASYVIGWPARIAHLFCVFLLLVSELVDFEFSKDTLLKTAICIFLYGIAAYHDGPMSDPALLFVFAF